MDKELQKIADMFNKKYGKDLCAFGMSPKGKLKTGIFSIDRITNGGLPQPGWSMIYGAKGSGKTSLCNHIIANTQKNGGKVILIDAEASWDPEYASKFGVDTKNLLILSPDTLEQSETIIQQALGATDLIVFDTVVAAAASGEQEKEFEKDTMALIARKLSEFFRKVTPQLGKSKCAVLLVNQIRSNPGAYIQVDTYPGGHALQHNCSLILHVRRGAKADWPREKVEGKDNLLGFQTVCKVEKTKVSATEGQVAFYNLYWTPPVFRPEEDLINLAMLDGVITQAGASYEYDTIKGRGRDAFVAALLENKEVMTKLKNEMK